jgi:hypothetical protein
MHCCQFLLSLWDDTGPYSPIEISFARQCTAVDNATSSVIGEEPAAGGGNSTKKLEPEPLLSNAWRIALGVIVACLVVAIVAICRCRAVRNAYPDARDRTGLQGYAHPDASTRPDAPPEDTIRFDTVQVIE